MAKQGKFIMEVEFSEIRKREVREAITDGLLKRWGEISGMIENGVQFVVELPGGKHVEFRLE